MKNFQTASSVARGYRSSLALGAVTIYLLNSLNSRPAGGRRYDQLLEICCQHVPNPDIDSDDEGDDEDSLIPILYGRGLYFLSDIVVDDIIYRMPMQRPLDPLLLANLYERPDISTLETDMGVTMVIAEKGSMVNPNRIPNKRQRTTEVQYIQDDTPMVDFGLERRGVEVRPREREYGMDVDNHHTAIADSSDEEGNEQDIDAIVSKIWAQVPYDIFAKAANGKKQADPPHLIMSNAARSKVTWDAFHTTDLSAIFEKAQIRMTPPQFWQENLFARYFPPKGAKPKERGKLQNFPYMTYYQKWVKLMGDLSEDDAKVVRAAVWKRFKKVKWLPHADTDRMWVTKNGQHDKRFTMYPKGADFTTCPQLAVNTQVLNGEEIVMGVMGVPRREEEESSDSE